MNCVTAAAAAACVGGDLREDDEDRLRSQNGVIEFVVVVVGRAEFVKRPTQVSMSVLRTPQTAAARLRRP